MLESSTLGPSITFREKFLFWNYVSVSYLFSFIPDIDKKLEHVIFFVLAAVRLSMWRFDLVYPGKYL